MISKINNSLKSIDYKMYFALLILGFVPTIYTSLRVFFVGQLPSEWSYSIAGQLSWVNLIYEILMEAILLPLFFFMGKAKDNNVEFVNRTRTGLLVTAGIYSALSAVVFIFTKPLLLSMAADPSIISASARYIRIESIANVISVLSQFILVALVTLNKSKYLYGLTALRFVLCVLFDLFFVSSLPFSLQLGVNGIGFSNIVVNALVFATSLLFLSKENIPIFKRSKLDFKWIKDFFKIGTISGFESFVRNVAYIVMISRMVNVVGEQGTYWVANNFIWGWLLLPVLQLGELIKKDVATDENNIQKNTLGYIAITTIISLLWLISIPLWKPFFTIILGFNEIEKLHKLVLILIGFYILFAVQNIFDSTFYGLGKTNYMLFESIITNSIYYGTAFVLYSFGVWTPTLTSIALLFGIGNAFDCVVSLLAYIYLLRKNKINILI